MAKEAIAYAGKLIKPVWQFASRGMGWMNTTFGKVGSGAIYNGVAQGVNTAIQGGSMRDVLRSVAKGAVIGAATAVVGIGLHGLGEGLVAAGSQAAAKAGGASITGTLIHTAAHGVVGGAMSAAQGGTFQDGFIGAIAGNVISAVAQGVGSAVLNSAGLNNVAGRTAISALAGGLAAKANGGSFAQGAISAGMLHLYNAEAGAAIERWIEASEDFTAVPWLSVAASHLGSKNGSLFWKDIIGSPWTNQSWCATFANSTLEKVGFASPHSAGAQATGNWGGWGITSAEPLMGAVATIYWKGEGNWKGHSTFVVGQFYEGGRTWIVGLGGNQSGLGGGANSVN